MKQFLSNLAILFLFLFLTIEISAANSIILKSGKTIKGTVINQNEKGLTVKLADGSTQTIEKYKILKVVYKDVSEEEEKKIRIAEEKKLSEKLAKDEEARKKKEEEEAKKQAKIDEKNRLESEKDILAKKSKEEELREKARREGTRKVTDVLWRSAVLPGWGFFHADRKVTGAVYSGLFTTSLLYALATRSKVDSAKSEYEDASLYYQVARPDPVNFLTADGFNFGSYYLVDTYATEYVKGKKNDFKGLSNRYNGALGLALIVYITQLTHTYFMGQDWVEEEFLSNGKAGLNIDSKWESAGINSWEFRSDMGYTWKF